MRPGPAEMPWHKAKLLSFCEMISTGLKHTSLFLVALEELWTPALCSGASSTALQVVTLFLRDDRPADFPQNVHNSYSVVTTS